MSSTRRGVLAELDDPFAGWRTSYGHLGTTFCSDGLVGEDELGWAAAKPRILFLAKESNDRNGVMAAVGYSLPKLVRDSRDFWQNSKLFERNRATWALGIHSTARGQSFNHAQAAKSREAAAAALGACAIMNLKKMPGGGQCHHAALRTAAMRDAFWIGRQIQILAPTLIVCCGTFAIAAEVLSGFEAVRGIPGEHCRHGIPWIDHWHPSYVFAQGGVAASYARLMEVALPLLRQR